MTRPVASGTGQALTRRWRIAMRMSAIEAGEAPAPPSCEAGWWVESTYPRRLSVGGFGSRFRCQLRDGGAGVDPDVFA
jgi:hypothetical protein